MPPLNKQLQLMYAQPTPSSSKPPLQGTVNIPSQEMIDQNFHDTRMRRAMEYERLHQTERRETDEERVLRQREEKNASLLYAQRRLEELTRRVNEDPSEENCEALDEFERFWMNA